MINDKRNECMQKIHAPHGIIIYHLSFIISEKESFGITPKLSFSVGVDGFEPPTLCL